MKPQYRIKEITTGGRTFYYIQLRHRLLFFSVWSTVQGCTYADNWDREFESIESCKDYINKETNSIIQEEKIVLYI